MTERDIGRAGGDLRELDRRAVRESVAVVARVTRADLGRPTPCAGWTLADLLAHMTAQHRGFAAAAEGHGGEPTVWQESRSADPVAAYQAAAAAVVAAFDRPGVLDSTFDLSVLGLPVIPARLGIGFHLVDYVVHGWDVARALGVPFTVDESVARAAREVALKVPDDERRRQPGASFQPAVETAADAGALDQTLAALGRSPTWTA